MKKQLAAFLFRRMQPIAQSREPDFIVGGIAMPYMHRWWIIPRNSIFNVYFHHFLRSDEDEALHDHPWWNFSFLLQGEYTEVTIARGSIVIRTVRRAGDFKLRSARFAHRIELHNGPCWSLFITGPIIREWGFHCANGWKKWKDFVSLKSNNSERGRGCD